MRKLTDIEPRRVFEHFEDICNIPHGSGNMEAISTYLLDFANKNGLEAVCDDAYNVIIYKNGTGNLRNAEPIILQGHTDMVCQKTEECDIDFIKDGLSIYKEGDFVKAEGTTLGADNGIAVAMIMAILENNEIEHPPIEAVFTTDEEVGMLGAARLDVSCLKGRRMINLDAEEADFVTTSCAGGSDVKIFLPIEKRSVKGTKLVLKLGGLKGGHSGVDIDKGCLNANILLGRILAYVNESNQFGLVSINGGDKVNAIPFCASAELVCSEADRIADNLNAYFQILRQEIREAEPKCTFEIIKESEGEYEAFKAECKDKLLYMLQITPNGIETMSCAVSGLVETSLNLGILATKGCEVLMQYALRSNKASALDYLEDKLKIFANYNMCRAELSGRYEPWEYKESSKLRDLYVKVYADAVGKKPQIYAIHAGLECAMFSARIKGLDCIAVGPDMYDVHTTKEKLSISSVAMVYDVLCKVLAQCN